MYDSLASWGEDEGEDAGAKGDGFGGGVFIGAVRDAVAAGNEDHGDGRDGGDEAGVVVGAGDHFFVRDGFRGADGFEGGEDVGVADGGDVGVDLLLGDGDAAAGLDVVDVGVEGGLIWLRRVTSVSRMSRVRLTREGTELMAPGWTATVPTVATESMVWEAALAARVWRSTEEDELGGGAEGVAAIGHEEGPGVAAEAGDLVAVAGGGRRCW